MAKRGSKTGIDNLTSQELIRYQALEDMAIAMINLGMTYQDIKTMVFRPLKKRTNRRVRTTKKRLTESNR